MNSRKSEAVATGFAVIAIVGILGLSAWWWIESETDAAFIEEIDVALSSLYELRTSAGSKAVDDPEMIRAIEEHEMTLDVFAISLFELRGDSSDDAIAALARIRAYRQKHPRTTSQPEHDDHVQQALGSKVGSADDR